jgi:biopolymer transport protein ExbD
MASSPTRRGAIIEGINVTPLVDIVLVLLVIFIVTAKLVVAPAVPLDLPRASQSEALSVVFAVSIPASGPLLVDGRPLGEEALEARAREALAAEPELRAVIQAERQVSHGRVMGVLDTLMRVGLTRVAFGALPSEVGAPAEGAGQRAP